MTSDSRTRIAPDPDRLSRLQGEVVVIKYGGNTLKEGAESGDEDPILDQVVELVELGIRPVLVHGGGPVIQRLLKAFGVESEFVFGHRKTDPEAMRIVELALRGEVNGLLVKRLNRRGVKAVGLSGKDASMVKVKRRIHREELEGEIVEVDLGFVGDVAEMDPELIEILLKNGYLPVIAPISQGEDGEDYNVNADLFAGHLAGALQAAAFVAVTDVDGLMKDLNDPDSHIDVADAATIRSEMGRSIQGGMIPKVEACLTALEQGVGEACIVSGMKADRLVAQLVTNQGSGTTIKEHL